MTARKDPAAVSMGRRGGAVKTEAKAEAARVNGARGGRPRVAEVVERFDTGRRIASAGTDWPVELHVIHDRRNPRGKRWVVTEVYNGIGLGTATYPTRRAATAACL